MKTPLILKIAVASPVRHAFDYLSPEHYHPESLIPGVRVRVPFRKTSTIGILLGTETHSSVAKTKLKQAIEILDDTPLLTKPLLALMAWASQYYHYSFGEILLNALPALLRQGLPPEIKYKIKTEPFLEPFLPILNDRQQEAIQKITASFNTFETFLLHGITGSGKTEVYLRAIQETLKAGKQALILVPEIGLTPQTLKRFQDRFPVPIAVLHSGLTARRRLDAWLMAKENIAPIVIGTRSAVFTPLGNIGIIIVDEEHDLSFKQQEKFRYSARDLAIMRGHIEKVPVILGSATPSLESYYHAKQKRYHLLSLPERAGTAIHPSYKIIDIRNQLLEAGLSSSLLQTIQHHLDQKGQVLLFLNRRGYAPTLICHACGWAATCQRCDARLTLHHEPYQLHCHHCSSNHTVNTQCPTCQQKNLLPIGVGTERLESVLKKHFPDVAMVRVDRDSTRQKGSMQKMLTDIHSGHSRILIGTQMLAKGHHFPEVTLAAMLNVDSGLYCADFRATERLAQILIQVAGRAGRANRAGEVIIQTHNPDHPLLLDLIQNGYASFAEIALQERQSGQFPPYSRLALLRAETTQKDYPIHFLREIKNIAMGMKIKGLQILGPIPASMEKRAGRFRAQLLFQSTHRQPLHHLFNNLIPHIESHKTTKKVRWSLDIDPVELF